MYISNISIKTNMCYILSHVGMYFYLLKHVLLSSAMYYICKFLLNFVYTMALDGKRSHVK